MLLSIAFFKAPVHAKNFNSCNPYVDYISALQAINKNINEIDALTC